jgi:hypothetical protein
LAACSAAARPFGLGQSDCSDADPFAPRISASRRAGGRRWRRALLDLGEAAAHFGEASGGVPARLCQLRMSAPCAITLSRVTASI